MNPLPFPNYFPLQGGIDQPQVPELSSRPSIADSANFSDRGDRFLVSVRNFFIGIEIANNGNGVAPDALGSIKRGDNFRAYVNVLKTSVTPFPIQKSYLGAFSADPTGADKAGLSVGDLYFNATDGQMMVYYPRTGPNNIWNKISFFFNPASPLDVTQFVRYASRIKRQTALPVGASVQSLNLNLYSHFTLTASVPTTLEFVAYTPSIFGPDAISFTLDLTFLGGASVTFPSNVQFHNQQAPLFLPDRRYLIKFTGSRNLDSFLARVVVSDASKEE